MPPLTTRRAFLGLTTAAIGGYVLDPERLLWRPGAKTFFLPSPSRTLFPGALVVRVNGRWRLADASTFSGSHLIGVVGDDGRIETHGSVRVMVRP